MQLTNNFVWFIALKSIELTYITPNNIINCIMVLNKKINALKQVHFLDIVRILNKK